MLRLRDIATGSAKLPVMDLSLKLLAKDHVTVNGWIVVAEADPSTASTGFIEGGRRGQHHCACECPAGAKRRRPRRGREGVAAILARACGGIRHRNAAHAKSVDGTPVGPGFGVRY